jgi:Holliday junction resolvase
MSMTPENRVKGVVVNQLKELGCYYFFPATGGYGKSGVPDIICCHNGKFLAIECKAGKNKPTALQLINIDAIQEAGGTAIVINETNIDTLQEILNTI